MNEHIFLPGVKLDTIELLPEYQDWLSSWLSKIEDDLAVGEISSSMCVQGVISEILLYGSPQTDWLSFMDKYLSDKTGKPIAYSEKYGKRLYKFATWHQSEVHAIHARWWIDQLYTSPFVSSKLPYGELIQNLVQPSGWIYNPKVSITQVRLRMKSEYMMSMAMGLEILATFDLIAERRERFESTLASVPITEYLSAEHFRLRSLRILHALEQIPVDLNTVLESCKADQGYCDFSVQKKVDEYMGTSSRTKRDFPVHSPLSSLHAYHIASVLSNDIKENIFERLVSFGKYLQIYPMDIPAFKIRDLNIPFGSDITPLEIIAASSLIALAANHASHVIV